MPFIIQSPPNFDQTISDAHLADTDYRHKTDRNGGDYRRKLITRTVSGEGSLDTVADYRRTTLVKSFDECGLEEQTRREHCKNSGGNTKRTPHNTQETPA